ncbi:hypothetical protein LA080_011960 [Diaporthe eres]|uniref:Uncharacterized protein n=1 Tax=Diaporthe vaccinii TaxID=105482 RepID=A0ABR4DVI3_9PEZI|nr:hypothetical protein LA080_011960 [Diaporthe eres]
MTDATQWLDGIEGNFPIHKAVVDAMPTGTKVIASESSGVSFWTKTTKVSVILLGGNPASYFLKCATGQSARALAEGEHHSATNVNKVVPGFGPKAIGWGEFED